MLAARFYLRVAIAFCRAFCYSGAGQRRRVRFGRRRKVGFFGMDDLRNAPLIDIRSFHPELVPTVIRNGFRNIVGAVDFFAKREPARKRHQNH